MQRTINYFNSWCINFDNFNDTAIPSNFTTVWTYRYADALSPISPTGIIIILLATNIIELVQHTLLKLLQHSLIKMHLIFKYWISAKLKKSEKHIKISINPYEIIVNIPISANT